MKVNVNINLPVELVEIIKTKNVNISLICEEALRSYINLDIKEKNKEINLEEELDKKMLEIEHIKAKMKLNIKEKKTEQKKKLEEEIEEITAY